MSSTLGTNVSATARPEASTSMPIPAMVAPTSMPIQTILEDKAAMMTMDKSAMSQSNVNALKGKQKYSVPPPDPIIDPVVKILSDGRVQDLIREQLLVPGFDPLNIAIDNLNRGLFMPRKVTRSEPIPQAPVIKGKVPMKKGMKGGQYYEDDSAGQSYGQPTGYSKNPKATAYPPKGVAMLKPGVAMPKPGAWVMPTRGVAMPQFREVTEILPPVMETILSNLATISTNSASLTELNGKLDTLNNTMIEVREAIRETKPSSNQEGGRRRRQTKDKRKRRGKTRR